MYFNANLTIDPSQLTEIKRVPPTKAFKRILYFMTLGAVSDRVEQETFTAVSILQQLYKAFDRLGVNNLVRLSHDGIDFYLDAEGKHDDLKQTLDKYDLEINEAMSKQFDQLLMVLEHRDKNFHYLISITINRTHQVGTHPIDIQIDGLMEHFRGGDEATMRTRMTSVFANQSAYDAFILAQKSAFEHFVHEVKMAIATHIRIKKVNSSIKPKIVIPRQVPTAIPAFQQRTWTSQTASPVYHGYYGVGDSFFYAWLWADLCHGHHIHVHHTTLVTEDNHTLMNMGDTSVAADTLPLFDTQQPFEQRLEESNIQYNEKNDAYENPADLSMPSGSEESNTDTTKYSTSGTSWFGEDSNSGSNDSNGSTCNSNGSNCSSGSSCSSGGSNCSSSSSCSSSSCGSSCSS